MKAISPHEIEAVAAVIERDGLFLITKRLKESHLGHCWEFPGGKREKGETVEECAVRECQEEIGVVVEPIRYLKAVRYEYPEVKVFLHFVLCRLVSGEPQPIECAEPTWIRPEDFSKYEFPAADRSVIEGLIQETL
ncbi:MAG: 8-oxo-dGTP diphosphatase MutT [Deltaproteobacteria bacterium]|nr:8-oxo-dGTP diphosphatase MutT [Deltaproteobacteria bacterium]